MSNGNFPENPKGDGKWYNFNGVILLTSFQPFYASLVESLRLNDKYKKPAILRTRTPEIEKQTSRTTRYSRRKTEVDPRGSRENPVFPKTEKDHFGRTIDISKQCRYCQRVKK